MRAIEDEIERSGRDGVAISPEQFTSRDMCRSATRFGIKQVVALGFVRVTAGARRTNTFARSVGWCVLDQVEAARLVKLARKPMQRASSSKPVVPLKAVSHRSRRRSRRSSHRARCKGR